MLIVVCRFIVCIILYFEVGFQRMSKQLLLKFGNRIRELRVAKGLSQEELAALAGVHRTYIGMIERAEKNITLSNIQRIAGALEVDIGTLFADK